MAEPVTVAIPVRDGGERLAEVLGAVRSQLVERRVEILVADSGSRDGSRELAAAHGARVIELAPSEFSHGGTRNLLVERSRGAHVAFLTQDAVPAHERWLAELLAGFDSATDVGLVFGPYLPRADASVMVRRELEEWFASLSPDGGERVEHGTAALASGDVRRLFFTDANGCVARAAWLTVPFRAIGYAEDHQLARDMLAAGFAKVYRPNAAVIHSHDYPPVRQLRRSFDEWRGMQEVHSIAAPASPLRIALTVQRELRDDIGHARRERGGPSLGWTALRSLAHHIARALGAALGSHAGRLPAALRRALSLEGRVDLSAPVEAPR